MPADLEQEVVLGIEVDRGNRIGRGKEEEGLALQCPPGPAGQVGLRLVQAAIEQSLVGRILVDVPENHPAAVVLDPAHDLRWRKLKLGRAARHDHGQVGAMALDPPRKAVSQVGDRLQRQERILGQRVIYCDRTPTEARCESITVQPEHRTGSNKGHVLTLLRVA